MKIQYISPMKAEVMPSDFRPTNHIAEIKYDGHRHLVHVEPDKTVHAWSANCKNALRKMDDELKAEMSTWHPGIYDGELHLELNETSSDVSKLENRARLNYTIFDVLGVYSPDSFNYFTHIPITFADRIQQLLHCIPDKNIRVHYQEHWYISTEREIQDYCEEIWNKGGEGLIIKDCEGIYEPGKRRKYFLKVKSEKSIEMTIIHYEPPTTATEFGIVIIQKDNLHTSVKVPNLELRERFLTEDLTGRDVLIEYQGLTPYGKLRHPRFDRFADE